ncbi:hypothetical protein J3T98_04575 [Gilliamella sp. B2772]|uniref:hypothetical protein n=1 Tax=Gilliamella sp. B2772 TaxID=2817981 RepID=UPI00226A86F1|nr:hypothetical protein [Gilliamella sp. B2772]MCX8660223.1 hypothetical protein [Gilliamella sp. B2772]
MKNYIYLFFLTIFLLTGCDNQKKAETNAASSTSKNQEAQTENNAVNKNINNEFKSQSSILVSNSYLFHTEPELLPHKKLIKHQKIQGLTEKTINYNAQGYVQNYDLEGLYGEINYDTAKYIYGMKDVRNNYDVSFDDSKNIIGMKDDNGDIVAINEFDEQGHLVETTLSNFADNNIVFNSKIIYNGDLVEQVLYNAYIKSDERTKLPVLVREKDIVYNTNNQLEKTITRTYKLSAKGNVIINDKNEQELESTETCTYFAYNENNDWTKAVCETVGEGSSKIDLTRTIEYL